MISLREGTLLLQSVYVPKAKLTLGIKVSLGDKVKGIM